MAAFYNVPISSVVKIKVIEPSLTLTADELALKEIPVSAIIESQDVNPFTSECEWGDPATAYRARGTPSCNRAMMRHHTNACLSERVGAVPMPLSCRARRQMCNRTTNMR